MNTSIEKIITKTTSDKVREFAAKLMSAGNRKCKVEFVKKDGSLRTMVCSLRTNWNTMNGFDTTKSGLKMLATKVANEMATVTEWLGEGSFRPRTLNLSTITSLTYV